ncbi:VWA domain-containing protein [Planctomycetes bacterium TBK1r]|uniref:von Willebrand factor type A domain protein n=1 Tax=Stieleria magnilauensis TaxID=2527963 RepID=A0ABX5Y0M0_9BACT|nr:von Willebrand factor type A domain protein [Planctomycetes bacterium TBK1r]
MSDFRFATPGWSAALWVVLATFITLLYLEQRRGDALARFLSPVMQPRLVSRSSLMRRSMTTLLLGLASVCFVLALMRPQYGLTYVKAPRVGAQIMFCLDVSKSMLAEDVAPNRLERAKADITDLLTFLDGDQVGLIGFAGRASVLCPLTPDYGFFKLVLDGAGPNSVGRGGTRLEEPLRKALDGFRSESDVSRVVFLITDGEDHDSHPLDVAKDAIERGIKIVAVGLGDEAGSEIRITDPRTGVQQQVLDADNRPVVTRLDGETLRELALATEGVYIPAGTGTLDLKSIYDAHIQPLVRGELSTEGRAIRRDAFQWLILAGLILLVAAVVLGHRRAADAIVQPDGLPDGKREVPQQATPNDAAAKVALVLLITATLSPGTAIADQTATDQSAPAIAPADNALDNEATDAVAIVDADEPMDARESYNRGLDRLSGDLDEAERLLSQARRDAGSDGEVRFRATYNLGWVEINRADAIIEEEPEQALQHLQRAAGWFRDAIRLRSDADDARHNLEVVLLRITQLRDQLMKQDDQDLTAQLDALIAAQRQTISNLRALVQQIAESDDPNIADQHRTSFQRLAIDQRVALSDLQGLVEQAAGELETLESKAESERTPEENIRIAQLASLLSYLNQGSQRIGQSRSQLRRRQASRGFRRAATALNQLKRARDQLRQPLEILDALSRDITETAQHTALKAMESRGIGGQDDSPVIPRWIDQEFLADSQADLTGRTEELTNRLAAGLDSTSQDDAAADIDAEQQAFFEKLSRAMPHLNAATDALKTADEKLAFPDYAAASEQQVNALKELQRAREQFADLKTLIELAYAGEQEIGAALAELIGQPETAESPASESAASESPSAEALPADAVKQLVDFISERQAENLRRMQRLRDEIVAETAKAQASQDESAEQESADPASDEPSQEMQRLTLAMQLAERASEQMNAVVANLPDENAGKPTEPPLVAEGRKPSGPPQAPPSTEPPLVAEGRKPSGPPQAPPSTDPPLVAEGRKPSGPPQAPPSTDPPLVAEGRKPSGPPQAPPSTDPPLVAEGRKPSGPPQAPPSETPQPYALSQTHAEAAIETLQDLRRLFFSIVEHLRETAQRQAGINDETEQMAALQSESDSERQRADAAELASRQNDLSEIAGQIASALEQLADASTDPPADPGGQAAPVDPQQQEMIQQNAEKAKKAAGLVRESTQQMDKASEQLSREDPQIDQARPPQDLALEKLIEALRELQPPQQDQSNQQQNQQQQQQDQQQQQSDQNQPQEQNEEQDAQMDPSRVLQAVRDREAQRRRERDQRQRAGQIPVEKDW